MNLTARKFLKVSYDFSRLMRLLGHKNQFSVVELAFNKQRKEWILCSTAGNGQIEQQFGDHHVFIPPNSTSCLCNSFTGCKIHEDSASYFRSKLKGIFSVHQILLEDICQIF